MTVFQSSPPHHPHAKLARILPQQRLQTFQSASQGGTLHESLDLYVWDRNLAAAFLEDLAIVEVALREAIHQAATQHWGTEWYTHMPMDDRTARQLSDAWQRLPNSVRQDPHHPSTPGRLIANCMFGFWTNLFDDGGYVGRAPNRVKIDYDNHWPHLKRAFNRGPSEAKHQRLLEFQRTKVHSNAPSFTREWVHQVCKNVNDIRNRVAHHEPVINGFPLTGQGTRISILEGHQEILKLARMIDSRLGEWVELNSVVPWLISRRPTEVPLAWEAPQ